MKNLNIGDIFYILTDYDFLRICKVRICKVIKLIDFGDKMRRIIYEYADDFFQIMTSRYIDISTDKTGDTIFIDSGMTIYTKKEKAVEALNAAIKNLEEQKKKLNGI